MSPLALYEQFYYEFEKEIEDQRAETNNVTVDFCPKYSVIVFKAKFVFLSSKIRNHLIFVLAIALVEPKTFSL